MGIRQVGYFSRDRQGKGSALIMQNLLYKPVGILGLGINKIINPEIVRTSDIKPIDWGYGLWLFKGKIYQVDNASKKEQISSLVVAKFEEERMEIGENIKTEFDVLTTVGYYHNDGSMHVSETTRVYFPKNAFDINGSLILSSHIELDLATASDEKPVEWEYGLFLFKGLIYIQKNYYPRDQIPSLVIKSYETDKKIFKVNWQTLQSNKQEDETLKRIPIPQHVRIEVWRRDGGKCVVCGSREKLEYDHIIPISKGGSNTARNIELLCEKCNRSKGAKIG